MPSPNPKKARRKGVEVKPAFATKGLLMQAIKEAVRRKQRERANRKPALLDGTWKL